jgi:type IV pilus assembly protein PilY1
MGGTYQVAGAALYANTSKIRTITTPPPDLKFIQDALKVKTLAASLSGGAARIDVLIPGSNPKKYVYITPESLWSNNTGAILTFASISSSATHGAFILTWNDRLLGGDYDMDLTGFLRYDLVANSASPTGWDIKITTDVPANCSGAAGTHGFSVIGVTKTPGGASANGRYLTHQHWNHGSTLLTGRDGYLCGVAAYRTATNATTYDSFITFKNTNADGTNNNTVTAADGACYVNPIPEKTGAAGYCAVQDKNFAVTARFNMVGAANAVVNDPLWYAAKYGNFTSSTKVTSGANTGTFTEVALPTTVASWDAVKADGTTGPDGTPDGYYLARRPDQLEEQLRKALSNIIG